MVETKVTEKILVTGSCGFIFSNFIIYSLQETKWDLVSIDKLTYAGSLLNISHNSTIHNKRHKLYIGDVCDYHFVEKIIDIEKPDIIIHGAGESNDQNYLNSSCNFINTNIIGTHSLLEACRKKHVPKKFINVSSFDVYGFGNNLSENDLINPQTPYASSKISAEFLLNSYYNEYSFPVINIRPVSVFGPRQNVEKIIPNAIFNSICDKRHKLKEDFEKEWIYVKDLFYAIRQIVNSGLVGNTYNIGTGDVVKDSKILNIICDNFNILSKQKPVLNNKIVTLNSDKIKNLGWNKTYSFEEALVHTIGWYKANSWFFKNENKHNM